MSASSSKCVLRNACLEVELDLALGRIMRIARPGGPNVLWVDPLAAAHPAEGWQNHGGEKIWLWPQDAWPRHFGIGWPPPCEHPAMVLHEGPGLIIWAQPFQLKKGASGRIVRRFELTECSDSLRLFTLESDSEGSLAGFRPWSVLQIPRPELIHIHATGPRRHRAATAAAGHLSDAPHGWTLDPRSRTSGKWFFDAHRLETSGPSGTLRFELASPLSLAPSTIPAETAQVFIQGDADVIQPERLAPYIELEFVAPAADAPLDLRLSLGP